MSNLNLKGIWIPIQIKDFVELKEITRTMLVSLIDRIEVSEDKEITIYYKFNILNMRKLNDDEELINVG